MSGPPLGRRFLSAEFEICHPAPHWPWLQVDYGTSHGTFAFPDHTQPQDLMQSTGHPLVLVILVGMIAGVLFAIFAYRSRRRMTRLFLALVALCLFIPSGLLCVAKYPAIVDPRFRTYLLFYWDLGSGMNHSEVLASLAKWYPIGQESRPPRVVVDNGRTLEFVMTPDFSGVPANERIVLKMEAGLVTGKSYHADR